MILVKYDSNGNILWTKSYGGNKNEKLYSITAIEDDGVVVVGKTDSTNINGISNKGLSDAIILKFDKDGNLIWQQSYGGEGDDEFNNIATTKDNGLVVVGDYNSSKFLDLTNNGSLDSFILKYDKNNNIEWQKNYGGNGYDIFESIYQKDDGGYIITGESTSTNLDGISNMGGFDGIIIEYDINLNIELQHNYGGNDLDVLGSYTKIGDKVILSGYSDSTEINSKVNNGKLDAFFTIMSYKYDINKIHPENGTYELEITNNKAILKQKANLGYKLEHVIIKNHLNENISYTEKDGIYYFDLNDDITVEVKFKKILDLENPNTGGIGLYIELFIGVLLLIWTIYEVRNKIKNNI